MRTRCPALLVQAGLTLWLGLLCANAAPPDDFPRFYVPNHDKEMSTLRNLFWLHYPGAGPKATLWDEWLPDASLWPAVSTDAQADHMRSEWAKTLSARVIDPEGYVATHQHQSIAHQLGWPFPFWTQGRRGCGWHFSFKNTIGPEWRPNDLSKPDGWLLTGALNGGITEDGWSLRLTNAGAFATAPVWKCHTFEVPFLQLRWQVTSPTDLQPFVEWTTPSATNFAASRRMYFESPKGAAMTYTMIPMYHHPQWTGEVAQLRIGFGNAATNDVTLQAFFSQYDTRHNINSQNFVRGCAKYFWWTRDLAFLRANINRMRTALRYVMTEHHALDRKVVCMDWVGHDGRTGLVRAADGAKTLITGQGIGNNYWDLLPFGGRDAFATIQYYDALRTMAIIEREIRAHPEWQIPGGILTFDAAALDTHAEDVKAEGNHLFWNPVTKRFHACVDSEGKIHDYGFTFLNCEAIYYDFATAEHAQAIMTWLNGERIIDGDTAQGADIYHWRFAPRATTRRNVDWYFWAWSAPESIPWGGQVQDGGAVLGFSYHDLMARLKTLGPDNAWQRLQEILRWFDEVQAAGGYRNYYNGSREGSMQGGGTAGGLGLDKEFFESAMVPQIVLNGFLGFAPRADGFKLDPRLPKDWPQLEIHGIRFHDLNLRITAKRDEITILATQRPSVFTPTDEPFYVKLPEGKWRAAQLRASLPVGLDLVSRKRESDGAYRLNAVELPAVRFWRVP